MSVFYLLQLQTLKNLRHFFFSECSWDSFPLTLSLLPLPSHKHQQNRKAVCQTEINVYSEYIFHYYIDPAHGHLDEADYY